MPGEYLTSIIELLAAALSVVVFGVGLLASMPVLHVAALVLLRLQILRPSLKRFGKSMSIWRFARTSWSLVQTRVNQPERALIEELSWLSAHADYRHVEPIPLRLDVRLPFTFANSAADPVSERLQAVSRAYRRYGTKLQAGWILRSVASPSVNAEQEVATRMQGLLDECSGFLPLPEPEGPTRGLLVDISPNDSGRPRAVRLLTWPVMRSTRSLVGFSDVSVSYELQRVVTGDSSAVMHAEGRRIVEVPPLMETAIRDPLSFDGVISRWHGPGHRVEIDRITGRQRLHLCLSETTFFTFQRTQHPANQRPSDPYNYAARVLSGSSHLRV